MDRSIIRQAQEFQAKMAKAQEELSDATVEVSAGGGAIKILITGQQQVQKVTLLTDVDIADRELLEDLILTAVNEAIAKSQELAQDKMGAITAGLKLPGMPGMSGSPGLGRKGFW
ncbi:MAG: YbaB/EbfC family nucleoid-associated protein [Dehalococcoidia bacterium]|jgi:hypothetical protein|nr:YbaB/EbfC family nucleoid-associated protein [Dehalococcoidia bacterium]